MKNLVGGASMVLLLGAVMSGQSSNGGTACERLATLMVRAGTITQAETVAAGTFAPPGGEDAGAFRTLPGFCRVAATLKPSSDSDIKIEVWLPLAGWNGKWQAVGNGAFNGNINYGAMSTALRRGYATSSTDTGHTGGGANWALGHPEKVVDFGWRAVHEMAVASKQIVASHYDRAPTFSVLERVLCRRTSGDESRAALPCGFRRHYCGRTGAGLDVPCRTSCARGESARIT